MKTQTNRLKLTAKPACICGCPEFWHGYVPGRGTACEGCGKCPKYLARPSGIPMADLAGALAVGTVFMLWLAVSTWLLLWVCGVLFR